MKQTPTQINGKQMSLLGILAVSILLPIQHGHAQVSYWPAEGSAADVRGTNNGTLVGPVSFTSGIVGEAFAFNGTNSYISIASSPTLFPGTNSFSLEAWIQTTNGSGAGERYVFSLYEAAGAPPLPSGNSFYGIYLTNGCPRGKIRDTAGDGPDFNGTITLVGTNNVADGSFHHLAMVRDVAGTNLLLYLDGALIVQKSLAIGGLGPIVKDGPAIPFLIGAEYKYQTYPVAYSLFQGRIDEVKYWNRALSPAEIGAEYQAASFQIFTAAEFTAVELLLNTQTNVTYQIQYITQLCSTNWTNLGSPLEGDGTIKSVFDSTRASGAKFYRLQTTR